MTIGKIKIGLTIRSDLDIGNIWHGNGISQNIKFLYDLFDLMGHEPYFVTLHGRCDDNYFQQGQRQCRSLWIDDACDGIASINIMIEAGVTVPQAIRGALREKGCKIVTIKLGSDFYMDVEKMLFGGHEPSGTVREAKPDALWVSPHFVSSASFFEIIYQQKADVSPYIWEPDFVGAPFTADDVPAVPDIYVMEPNINIVKNAMIPLCIIEQLYRTQPGLFGKAMILNGTQFNTKPYFLNNTAVNLSSTHAESNKVYFTGRYRFDEALQRADILLSHQMDCELNYLYLECLYRGVPLVHNSVPMRDYGMYYPGNDIYRGAEAVQWMVQHFNIDEYKSANQRALRKFSIHNESVQRAYSVLLNTLMSK